MSTSQRPAPTQHGRSERRSGPSLCNRGGSILTEFSILFKNKPFSAAC
jgi:hypothetical protein